MLLHDLLAESAELRPNNIAVEDAFHGSITYRDLDRLADGLRDILAKNGVNPGDRIGICAAKSIGTVAAIFGTLKAGAAYVPVDADAPGARNAVILEDCSVHSVFVESRRLADLQNEFHEQELVVVDELHVLDECADDLVLVSVTGPLAVGGSNAANENLAYILYTSGSTGKPKGVMHTHSTDLSFVNWCSEEFELDESDRFSSHAPFHFDLSILDIYVPIRDHVQWQMIGAKFLQRDQRCT